MKNIRQPLLHAGIFIISFIISSAILSFCSCSVLKLNKNKSTVKSDSSMSINENMKKVDIEETKDNSKITTVETIDKVVDLPGSTVTGEAKLSDVENKPLVTENADTKTTATVKNGKLSVTTEVKPKKINVQGTKTTIEHRDVFKKSNTKTEAKNTTKSEVKKDIKSLSVQKTTFSIPWWIWLILILLALGTIGYFVFRKYLKIQSGGLL